MANHLDYRKLVEGRTIALLGGYDEINWRDVHNQDLVVRVNGHHVRQTGRVDIVYDSCAHDVDHTFYADAEFWTDIKFVQLNIIHTFFTMSHSEYPWISNLLSKNKVPWDFYVHAPHDLFLKMKQLQVVPERHQWIKDFAKEFEIHALTGLVAIRHLLLQPIKSLYIDGMDLFHKVDAHLPRTNWHKLHYMPPQIRYLRSIMSDPRVEFSAIMETAVKTDSRGGVGVE